MQGRGGTHRRAERCQSARAPEGVEKVEGNNAFRSIAERPIPDRGHRCAVSGSPKHEGTQPRNGTPGCGKERPHSPLTVGHRRRAGASGAMKGGGKKEVRPRRKTREASGHEDLFGSCGPSLSLGPRYEEQQCSGRTSAPGAPVAGAHPSGLTTAGRPLERCCSRGAHRLFPGLRGGSAAAEIPARAARAPVRQPHPLLFFLRFLSERSGPSGRSHTA